MFTSITERHTALCTKIPCEASKPCPAPFRIGPGAELSAVELFGFPVHDGADFTADGEDGVAQ
jgi:hypothetical protein